MLKHRVFWMTLLAILTMAALTLPAVAAQNGSAAPPSEEQINGNGTHDSGTYGEDESPPEEAERPDDQSARAETTLIESVNRTPERLFDTPRAASEEETSAPTEGDTEASEGEEETSAAADLDFGLENLKIYGYFSTRFEKVFSEPSLDEGQTVRDNAPAEWSLPFFNVMLQHRLNDSFKVFVNLNGDGAGSIEVRNMWGEYSVDDYLNVRIGKIYRRFGLYNEILDAVPTYIGIEPPELFDRDHLILSRTSTLMVHGRVNFGPGNLNYAFTTDNGEGDPVLGTFPVGVNANYKFLRDDFTVGFSGYTSNGRTNSDIGLGDGSPRSGVLPWMESDAFKVYGGYFEGNIGSLLLQTEYWRSPHEGIRDPALVVEMIDNANPSPFQLSRFLQDPDGAIGEENVNIVGDYTTQTWYFRSGYSMETTRGEFVPYFQWDWYKNQETIAKKTYGGDNEAGVADDGQFSKWTAGLVYRPIPTVALKADTSSHIFKLGGETVSYPEIRVDVSFIFGY